MHFIKKHGRVFKVRKGFVSLLSVVFLSSLILYIANQPDENELMLSGFRITFSEDAKITTIYLVNECFALSWHVIICETFHSHVTRITRKKKRMESFRYFFQWTCQVYYGKEDVAKLTFTFISTQKFASRPSLMWAVKICKKTTTRCSQSIEIDIGNQSIHSISIADRYRLISVIDNNRTHKKSIFIDWQKSITIDNR